MKILSLRIKSYKIYEEETIKFSELYKENVLHNEILKNMNINLLVGANGSGKSSLLGFVCNIFHNLERYHSRIESDFKLVYEINNSSIIETIEIEKVDETIYFTRGMTNRRRLIEHEIKRKQKSGKNSSNVDESIYFYEEIREILPENIVVSCFDIDAVYPKSRTYNYIGDRIVKLHKVGATTISSGYGLGITKGVIKLYQKFAIDNKSRESIQSSLGIKFRDKVKFHSRFMHYDGSFGNVEAEDENLLELYESLKECHHTKSYSDFIEYITSYRYWHQFIEYGDDSSIYLNLIEYLKSDKRNYRVLDYLQKSNLIYINDIYIEKWDRIIPLAEMSSGEKIFIYRILSIMTHIDDNSLIIVDEPEVHLNENWSRQLVSIIALLFSNYSSHFLIATHSYTFVNNLFKENIMIFDRGKVRLPEVATFLASPYEIHKEFNRDKENYNVSEKLIFELLSKATPKELWDVYEHIGESLYKYLIYKKIKEV